MKARTAHILCFLLGLAVAPALVSLWLTFGTPPVAVGDSPVPFEANIVEIPLRARMHREMPASVPIGPTDANLNAGAGIYQDKCAFCHGTSAEAAPYATSMFPRPPQLWRRHGHAVGVSDDPVGETFWKIKNGIRLSGMPAYGKALTETQIWQVSLLLSRADKPLPAEAAEAVAQ
ncbi:MAG: cytochrome c [Acidobacteriota bacterium]|nr:cytochrome c [Acidobacteriota bacterium]